MVSVRLSYSVKVPNNVFGVCQIFSPTNHIVSSCKTRTCQEMIFEKGSQIILGMYNLYYWLWIKV